MFQHLEDLYNSVKQYIYIQIANVICEHILMQHSILYEQLIDNGFIFHNQSLRNYCWLRFGKGSGSV
jgi:hypothetical protein